MQKITSKNNYRILDANLNRLKEGLRVCEDICRFVLDDRSATRAFKVMRHDVTTAVSLLKYKEMIAARDIQKDVGKQSNESELTRKKIADIFFANVQRSKESIRVLEEFSKLNNPLIATRFKKIRYRLYGLEKKITPQL